MRIQESVGLLKSAFAEWKRHRADRLGAALAYYTVFSIAPLLIISISVASLAFGAEAARSHILGQVRDTLGPQATQAIEDMVSHGRRGGNGVVPAIVGLLTLLVGASGVFGQLQDAMNTIWDVEGKRDGGILKLLKDRFLSLTMVLGTGFLLLVSLVASAAIAAMTRFAFGGTKAVAPLLQGAEAIVTTGLLVVLFALIFKFLPDKALAWRDVWAGSVLTAVLFTVGKLLLGLYLGRSGMASAFGAAGSLIVILVWVYYAAQIFLYGAEVTKIHAEAHRKTGATTLPGFVGGTNGDGRGDDRAPGARTQANNPGSPRTVER